MPVLQSNFINGLVNLVFPKSCLLCEEILIENESHICLSCEYNFPICTDKELYDLKNKLFFCNSISKSWAYLRFQKEGMAQKLVHEIKYMNQPDFARFLGKKMAFEWLKTNSISDYTALIPVPIHKNKLKQRGYNQALCLAEGFSEISSLPINNKLLSKINSTTSQTNKNRIDRFENSKNVFTSKDDIKGDNFLLIDDVITTGATLASCAEAISKSNWSFIEVISLAVAVHY